ncbi:hypothetical protein RRG08_026056 [Elysia crispata]|uniref:Uncharacterized protein n=1 Tax=Elysia crispata TaxID=231223 RepID=A0AAE1D7X6_9GAST|nr:hypothetical protein RRG08_026056 [Elysia crispata]
MYGASQHPNRERRSIHNVWSLSATPGDICDGQLQSARLYSSCLAVRRSSLKPIMPKRDVLDTISRKLFPDCLTFKPIFSYSEPRSQRPGSSVCLSGYQAPAHRRHILLSCTPSAGYMRPSPYSDRVSPERAAFVCTLSRRERVSPIELIDATQTPQAKQSTESLSSSGSILILYQME